MARRHARVPVALGPAPERDALGAADCGATADNSAFAAYSGKKLGARLTPYCNTLDVVPHAWQASMLELGKHGAPSGAAGQG